MLQNARVNAKLSIGRAEQTIVHLMKKIKVMLKNRYLTAASSIALLTIIAGCAATESPQLASPSPVAESNPSPVKPSQPLIVSVNNPETPTHTKNQPYPH